MARVITSSEKLDLRCKITVTHTDGTEEIRFLKKDDEVEGLRYIIDETLYSATGRIESIGRRITRVTKQDLRDVQDYFAKDVTLTNILVDASEVHQSDLISIPAREIVEDEGVMDVTSVFCTPHPFVSLYIEYTDGTMENKELEVGDVLTNMVIRNKIVGKPDITGTFKIAAFAYRVSAAMTPAINGVYLTPNGKKESILVSFDQIISFDEADSTEVTRTDSLAEIATALNDSETGVVYATLQNDVSIPIREDGKITTIFIDEGKELNVDLGGHNLTCPAYAFYVSGGTLNICDSNGTGKIIGTYGDQKAYPMVQVTSGGTCNMESGIIDTTQAVTPEGKENWLYGVVCSGDGVFNMTGGKMVIKGASGISITNGTADGEGAKFIIGGTSQITSLECAAVYLADNKSVVVKDNAVLNGGIVARMGDITIEGNAVVNSTKDASKVYPLGQQVCLSGVGLPKAAFLALTGCYGSTLGNDMNFTVRENGKLNGYIDDAIDIAMLDTKYDQIVNINVEDTSKVYAVSTKWRSYDNAELKELAAAEGKTLGDKQSQTTLTVSLNGQVVYPEEESEG